MSEEKPKPIGTIIDELYAIRATRLAEQKKVDGLAAQEAKLRSIIIARLKNDELEGAKGKVANATITSSKQARMLDWPAFWEYCKENNGHDLIQKRVSITAVRARWEEGVDVPGLEEFELDDLSLTKR